MKHLPIKIMLSKNYKLKAEDIANFSVMQTDYNDNDACRIIEDLINKCIDDTLIEEQSKP